MPIFAYLVIPESGAFVRLCEDLANMAHCEVIPADNEEVAVLITDTPDTDVEDALQAKLAALPSLQSMNLTFGYTGEHKKAKQRGDHEAE